MHNTEMWAQLFFTHSFMFVLAKTVLDFFLAGLWGVFVLACSTLLENRVILLVSSYVLATIVSYLSNYVFSIMALEGCCIDIASLLRATGDLMSVTQ
ncbi:hypothetical protein K6V98_03960 [Collinsella sp. AGMB00827]|uniref:Uncharacterized protein n=1 Tax=Collinsella ureilytica TaxID=2869515 RepID=A0ABS7MJS2_9ACTN|nr:hypothetical protein [Collinsella urealyticum]MBY4797512.1 hypothetical protein [Collinsella urealyticum]